MIRDEKESTHFLEQRQGQRVDAACPAASGECEIAGLLTMMKCGVRLGGHAWHTEEAGLPLIAVPLPRGCAQMSTMIGDARGGPAKALIREMLA